MCVNEKVVRTVIRSSAHITHEGTAALASGILWKSTLLRWFEGMD